MDDSTELSSPPPRSLAREDGASIAYRHTPGRVPGVVFLTGYMSDMTGEKATALEAFCRARGQAFVRFDYTGHGASSGVFEDGTIGSWTEDAVFVLDRLTEGRQVLVGSSMGGWIMLLAALARPDRIAGLLGTAAAPDFTEDLIVPAFTAEQRRALDRDGVIYAASDYDDEPYPITKALIEDGRRHLLLGGEIPIDRPVRLIHGMQDAEVPWQTALRIAERLRTGDVETTLVKGGDHRLSEPPDLARLIRTLDGLLGHLEAAGEGGPDA